MLSNSKISKELRRQINNELQLGEVIRWVEQPIPRFFTADSISSVLFGIPWTGFFLFWIWGASSGFQRLDLSEGLQPQHLFSLLGVPFVLVGFNMLSKPIWVWQAARKAVYLVTDKRAISIEGSWSTTTVKSYLFDQLRDIYRKERADGTGDVILGIQRWKDNDGVQRRKEIGFLGVRNPREVENMLKQLVQHD